MIKHHMNTCIVYSRAPDMTMTVVDGVSGCERMTPFLNHANTTKNLLYHGDGALLLNYIYATNILSFTQFCN